MTEPDPLRARLEHKRKRRRPVAPEPKPGPLVTQGARTPEMPPERHGPQTPSDAIRRAAWDAKARVKIGRIEN
jgi:hypothetical protein